MGGFTLAAQADPLAYTEAARQRFRDSFAERIRADAEARGEALTDREVNRRAEALRRAHYARLALLSAQARSRRRPEKFVASRPKNDEVGAASAFATTSEPGPDGGGHGRGAPPR